MGPIIYDCLPPKPIAYPKLCRIPTDTNSHFTHKLTPAFLTDSKPLLTRCDVGLPFDELIVNIIDYENQEGELHPDDFLLIQEEIGKK
jgi:hypothetical protein